MGRVSVGNSTKIAHEKTRHFSDFSLSSSLRLLLPDAMVRELDEPCEDVEEDVELATVPGSSQGGMAAKPAHVQRAQELARATHKRRLRGKQRLLPDMRSQSAG